MIEVKFKIKDTRQIYDKLYDEIAANERAVKCAEKDFNVTICVWKNESGECFVSMEKESKAYFTKEEVEDFGKDFSTFLRNMEKHLTSQPEPECHDENDDKENDDEQLPPPPDQVDVPDDFATEEIEGFTVIVRMRKGYHLVFGTLPSIEIIAAAIEVCEHSEKNT